MNIKTNVVMKQWDVRLNVRGSEYFIRVSGESKDNAEERAKEYFGDGASVVAVNEAKE